MRHADVHPLLLAVISALGLATLASSCGPGPGDRTEEITTCVAQSVDLPPWLMTNVPPGAQIDSAKLEKVEVGMSWRLAVRQDSTLSLYVRAPEVFLDGVNLNAAATTMILSTFDIPIGCWTLNYVPERPLDAGAHQMRVIVRDTKDNVFDFTWEFCVASNQ